MPVWDQIMFDEHICLKITEINQKCTLTFYINTILYSLCILCSVYIDYYRRFNILKNKPQSSN